MIICFLLKLLLFLLLNFSFKVNSIVLTKEIDKIEICSVHQFFDTTSLSCKYCDPNSTNHKTPNQTSVDIYGNFLSCKCSIGYKEVENDCSQVFLIILFYYYYLSFFFL